MAHSSPEKVPRLLQRPPHPCGLGHCSSPHDEWAGGACQWYDFVGTQTEDLQQPQQVRQAVDERATLGSLESKDDAEPSHGFLAIFSSLWGRGRPPHGLRIWLPEDQGIRRPQQPDQPRGLAGPTRRGSGCCLTTFGTVPAFAATLPRPKRSAPRLPSGRLGASSAIGRPRAPQAHSSLGRAIHHRQDFEAQNIQAGQRPRQGLQQCLEHPTATSLLPLRCFKSFMYLVFFTYIKSNRQGMVGLASAKPDPPSRARRGEPPLRHGKFFSTKTTFVLSTSVSIAGS
jgi:hypothetical protein